MTDKELRKLSRSELLELLVAQAKETERLQAELNEANAKLESRELDLAEAGSIAEASLRLNGVFSAAQAAATQYLENIKKQSGQQEIRCRKMEEECRAKCEVMRQEAQAYFEKEKQAAEKYWQTISERLQSFYNDHQGLRELLTKVDGEHEG